MRMLNPIPRLFYLSPSRVVCIMDKDEPTTSAKECTENKIKKCYKDEGGEGKRKRHMKAIMQQEAKLVAKLKTDIDNKQSKLKISQNKMQMYKNMARTYWERWRWESQKRKESLVPLPQHHQSSHQPSTTDIPQINPAMLTN